MPQPTYESDDEREAYRIGWDDCAGEVVKAWVRGGGG